MRNNKTNLKWLLFFDVENLFLLKFILDLFPDFIFSNLSSFSSLYLLLKLKFLFLEDLNIDGNLGACMVQKYEII